MYLRYGHPVPSDLKTLSIGLRGAEFGHYARELREEVVGLLTTHPAQSFSDLDHYFSLGHIVKTVWPSDRMFFDDRMVSYISRALLPSDPALIAFAHGFQGKTFEEAATCVLDKNKSWLKHFREPANC